MKLKSIFEKLPHLFIATLLTLIASIVLQQTDRARERKQHETQKINLLKVARNEIDFYEGLYKQSMADISEMVRAAKTNAPINGDVFCKTVAGELLQKCKTELPNFNVNDTVIRFISGCHYNLINYDNDNKVKLKLIGDGKTMKYEDLEYLLNKRHELLTGCITDSQQAYAIITREIERYE